MSNYLDTENYIDLGNYVETSLQVATTVQTTTPAVRISVNTILLSSDWDMSVDPSGNIAGAYGNYALAQDVATACRLFFGELWYNTKNGIPYFEDILGKRPSRSLVRTYMKNAALTVPGVVDAKIYIDGVERRKLVGRIQFTDSVGKAHNVVL